MPNTSLERLVPEDKFYRKLHQQLDLHFLYKTTARERFVYNKEQNQHECRKAGSNNAILTFKGTKTDSKGYSKHIYRSSEKDCKNCSLRKECCGSVTKFKKIDDSIHKPLYDKMHQKLTQHKTYHRRLVKRRSATVEPVLSTLINHHSMRRLNSPGHESRK